MKKIPDHLNSSLLNYIVQNCVRASERTNPYFNWANHRNSRQVPPYQRTAASRVGRQISLAEDDDRLILNFSSQDYLGLAQDGRMIEAAMRGARDFGVHSAGSPAFCGSMQILRELETFIAAAVGAPKVAV